MKYQNEIPVACLVCRDPPILLSSGNNTCLSSVAYMYLLLCSQGGSLHYYCRQQPLVFLILGTAVSFKEACRGNVIPRDLHP